MLMTHFLFKINHPPNLKKKKIADLVLDIPVLLLTVDCKLYRVISCASNACEKRALDIVQGILPYLNILKPF